VLAYWLLFGFCAIGAIVARQREDVHRRHPMLWVAGTAITLMVGFRFDVGADWENYLGIFKRTGYASLETALSSGDPSYQLINWLVADNGGQIWVVNLVCAALFTGGLIRFCLSQPFPWIAITVAVPYIVIVVAMGYTRQGAALGIIMAGLADYLRRGSIMRLAGYVAFAATFHATAVLAFILVAMTVRRNRVVTLIGVIAVSILFYNMFLAASIERFVGIYLRTGYSSQGALIRVLLSASAGALFFGIGRKLKFDEVEYSVWRNFALASFGALIALAISPSSTAVDRVAIYLLPIQVAVFSRLPMLARRNEVSRILPVALFAGVQYVWLTYANHARLWLPYQFFTF
jgi:hypothetical protein